MTRTLAISNLLLTRTKADSPVIHLLKIYPRQLELPVNSKQFSYPFRGCSLHILPSITRTTSNLLCQYVTETKQTIQYKTFTLPCDFCSSLEFHFQPDFSPLLNLIKLFTVWIEKTISTSFFLLISDPFLSLSITRTLWRFKLSKFDCTS